jgi:hypothetical protein
MPSYRTSTTPTSLALIVVLRFDPASMGASVRSLRGAAGARALLEAILRFEVDDGVVRQREVELMLGLHDSAPMVELVRNAAEPGGVADFVLEALERRGGGA